MEKAIITSAGNKVVERSCQVNYKAFYGVNHCNWELLKAESITDANLYRMIENANSVKDYSNYKDSDHKNLDMIGSLLVIVNGPFETRIKINK